MKTEIQRQQPCGSRPGLCIRELSGSTAKEVKKLTAKTCFARLLSHLVLIRAIIFGAFLLFTLALEAQTIQWLPLPRNFTQSPDTLLLPGNSGNNPAGSWLVTNLACYGRVLITQTSAEGANDFANPSFQNVPNSSVAFVNGEAGFGPYAWGDFGDVGFGNTNNFNLVYNVNFYFLDGQPDINGLVLGVGGLDEFTTATTSQTVIYRGEFDIPLVSATTTITNQPYNSHTTTGSTNAGTAGTVIGSYYRIGGGDFRNTGWALFQLSNNLQTTNLPSGSNGFPISSLPVPYLSLAVNHDSGDGIGFTIGNICFTTCSNGCLIIDDPANITVTTCSNKAPVSFNVFVKDNCCSNCASVTSSPASGSLFPLGTTTVTSTATDTLGNSNVCTFTVTVVQVTNPPVFTFIPSLDYTTCGCITLPDFTTVVTATNWTGGNATITQSIPPGTLICASTNITFTATDACGDSTNLVVPININIPCPTCRLTIQNCANITVNSCTNVPVYYYPYGVDLCCSNNPVNCNPPSGSYFAPGTVTTVNCTVNDDCGNSNYCSFTVTVNFGGLQVNCPSNKVVQCGSAWTFDLPTGTTCCSDGTVHVASLGAVTNGTCPKFATNTWIIFDDCGDTNYCSQVVTMVDTTPPVIAQPAPVIVSLNTNCNLVVPYIQVNATDNCTPPCSLVQTQSPPAGTILSTTNVYVTVTVTDQCGNSSQVTVLVEGQYKKGLVVTWPASITVSNCAVPCVSNLLLITDCSCLRKDILVEQEPPCGSPVGPGVNSVSVAVTDCHGKTVLKTIPLNVLGESSFLSALTNTGIGNNGRLLAQNAVDPHYFLGPVAAPAPPDYTSPHALAITNLWPWLSSTNSTWIAPTTWLPIDRDLDNCAPGYYTYTNTFILPAGVDTNAASISGRWAADNGGTIYMNGFPTPNIIPIPGNGFSSWTSFTINSHFVSNINTIEFVVTNANGSPGYNPSGLRVEYTSATACTPCVAPYVIVINPNTSFQAGSTARLAANVGGTPPLNYQWQFNGVPIPGANSPTLQINTIDYSSAGTYSLAINNGCGGTVRYVNTTVATPLPWANASWNIADPIHPLAATYGPDLILAETNEYTGFALSTGTTEDFGLPNPGGRIVNVVDVNPAYGATIALPPVVPAGSNSVSSYTLIMDTYEPDTSLGAPATLFQSIGVPNLDTNAQDGVSFTLDASNHLHITGYAGGTPFDAASATPLPVNAWNRVALVVDNRLDGYYPTFTATVNGAIAISPFNPCPCCVPVLQNMSATGTIAVSNGFPTIFSVPTNSPSPNAEFIVSDIQFHAVAMTPQTLASIGSPEDGPMRVGQTSATQTPPVLTAARSNGMVNISWTGSGYALQESADITGNVWADSALPFTESVNASGSVTTTAVATPSISHPSKFYRLVFRP